MSAAASDVHRARAYLSRVAEAPAPALASLIAEEGPVGAARRVAEGRVGSDVTTETAARREIDQADADLAQVANLGGRLVVPEDDEWPAEQLRCLDAVGDRQLAAPLAFWVRGVRRLDQLATSAVAIIGARAASQYGDQLAAEFAWGLATHGRVIVSGAAFGIDGAAHRGALAADGVTVAVQACGLDRVYPAGHTGLVQRIVHSGAVISEYPPGIRPAKHRFLVRNRLIAALAAGTVVIEAGARSGARRTAAVAATLGREVMAVPGPVTSATSVGCHALVRDDHAQLVTRVEDILELLGPIGTGLASPEATGARPTDGLGAELLAVYEAFPARARRHPEQLARDAAVPLERVRVALPLLELRGLVNYAPDGWSRTA